MEFIVNMLVDLMYVGCFLCIEMMFLTFKGNANKIVNISSIVLVILSTVSIPYINTGGKIIVHTVCMIFILFNYFHERVKTIICSYLAVTAVLAMLDMIFEIVVDELLNYLRIPSLKTFTELIAQGTLLLYVLCFRKYFVKKYHDGIKQIDIKYWFFFTVVLLFDAAIVVVFKEFVVRSMIVERDGVLLIIFICVVAGILLQLVLLINTLITRNIYRQKEILAKHFLENQKEHYLYLEKRELETKKFRHDVKNHLLILESLISNQNFEDAESYLNKLSERIGCFNNRISVNNGIADAILNKFDVMAQENGIILNVKGHFPLDCYITAYDICTVLSNLLSNAIEAEAASKGKEVKVEFKYISDKVFIVVENDYQHKLERVDDTFKSTKTDAVGHGYGLSNVTECVEKKGGYVSISTENNRFKVMIMMLNEKEEI